MLYLISSLLMLTVHLVIGQLEGALGEASKIGVSSPNLTGQFPCGYKYFLGWHYGVFEDGEKVPFYYLNTTAKKLKAEGFDVKVEKITDDAIFNMTFSNGSYSKNLGFVGYGGIAAVGGKPALETRSYYMAQLGMRRRGKIHWLCDGALINRRWVLSAGHCFINKQNKPNFLRLGDYDVSVPPEQGKLSSGKFIEDYDIHNIVFHPEYTKKEWYHDLVLIPLERPTPLRSNRINPVCLPWGPPPDLQGKNVTLTGWGATKFRGPKTTLLQEVGLQVFDTSVCNKSYSSLDNFKGRYPKGLSSEETLCVGWPEGGKDACGGDSGAPLVYDSKDGFLLIGIVSSGFQCGNKEFPGLYVPITKPKYLQWIKDVAFKDYV